MFKIDVPPPTISGLLHMGHLFSYSHMDFVARAAKDELLYPFCFDCNGLPTQKLASQARRKDIVPFAIEKSDDYRELFSANRMGWSNHRYHSFDERAVEIARLSFEDLKAKDLVYKERREFFWCPDHKVSVSQAEIDEEGHYERSGAKVEIREGEGWFIRMMDRLPQIRAAIDEIEWKPDIFRQRLHRWLDGLNSDWSISRERDFGIQIPGETDVFDTWFTSSLSPQMTWASHTGEASLRCPIFDVRFQAHDIIRTWALFTIVKSLYHNDQIPWRTIVISGHALDAKGRKISKTAGNFVDPYAYLEKHGSYGVRYWAAQNQIGTDTRIDEAAMSKGRKLANKLRNAKRFLDGVNRDPSELTGRRPEWDEEWKNTSAAFDQKMAEYDWPSAIDLLTTFFWGTFCDVWIEDCKRQPAYESLREIFDGISARYECFLPGLQDEA